MQAKHASFPGVNSLGVELATGLGPHQLAAITAESVSQLPSIAVTPGQFKTQLHQSPKSVARDASQILSFRTAGYESTLVPLQHYSPCQNSNF